MDNIAKLTGPIQSFLQQETIAQFEDRLEGQRNYLLSFPRSGNGFIRYVMANILLAANGYDTSEMTQENYSHSKDGDEAQRFVFSKTGEKISVEQIVPDFHMNDDDWFKALDPKFFFGPGPLIKTHSVVPSNKAEYIYLYRQPLLCTVSYFNLVASDATVEAALTGSGKSLFVEAVTTYLGAYAKMGEMALEHIKTGQCRPLALHHIEDGNFEQFTAVIQNKLPHVPQDLIHNVLKENKKDSGFNKDIMKLVDSELDAPLAKADAIFDLLNKK